MKLLNEFLGTVFVRLAYERNMVSKGNTINHTSIGGQRDGRVISQIDIEIGKKG